MAGDNFFHWAGDKLGHAIRVVVDALGWLFGHIHAALDSFFTGLMNALGVDVSVFSVAVLLIGLAMLAAALSSLFKARVLGAIIWLALSLAVLSWLIR